jgi:riboflavin synthase
VLTVRLPGTCRALVVPKGPITVDGVNLTAGERVTDRVTLHLVPETLRRTTLADRAVGDAVNLELDYLGKLAARLLRGR